MLTRCLTLSVLALSTLAVATEVRGDTVNDAVTVEMKVLATELKAYFDKEGIRIVSIGKFDPPPSVFGSAGPELQLKLAEELKSLGILIDKLDGQIMIRGHYENRKDEQGLLCARVVVELVAANGHVIQVPGLNFYRDVYGQEATARLLGVAYESKPTASYESRSEAMLKAQQTPQAKAAGSIISNSPKPSFALELLVKQGDEYVPVQQQSRSSRNLPFVPIDKSQVYAVRLINNSPREAGVNLTIDGISCFKFSTVEPKPSFWVVPPGQSVLVKGWHISHQVTAEFKLVDFPETAAAKLKLNLEPDTEIGVIQAAFSAAWIGDARPEDEAVIDRGTGFGQNIEVGTQSVPRTIGQVRETIVVRYERGKE